MVLKPAWDGEGSNFTEHQEVYYTIWEAQDRSVLKSFE